MGLSSNTLWHQTNYRGLRAILKSKMLRYSYCKEDIFGIVDGESIAIPMISVCDLPFSELNSFLGKYGSCTIGFDVNWGVRRKFNPVWYCESHSLIFDKISKAFNEALAIDNETDFDLAYSILSYIKPKEGTLPNRNYKNYRFYDEREFRRCPTQKTFAINEIKPFLTNDEYNQYKEENGSTLLKIGVKFEWEEIKYIIVDNERQSDMIKGLLYENLKCTNSNISIFTEKQIKTDFIGTDHNISIASSEIEEEE